MAQDSRPPLAAADLFKLAFVGDCRLSPDGKTVAYSVKTTRFDDNKYVSHLYRVPAGGGEPQRLTFGDHSDTMPRWSPDGETLAFVSSRHEDRAQIHLLPTGGGEARRLTDLDGSISALEWAPDGNHLVIAYRPHSEEQIARREADKKDEGDKRPRFQVHTNVHFKEDGIGYLFDSFTHLYRVDAATGETLQLTDGETEDGDPVYSPDGKTIAFSSNRMFPVEDHLDNADICLVPAAGGPVTRLTTEYGPNFAPSFSPDGKTIAFMGCFCGPGESFWRDGHLWKVDVQGGKPVDLTPDLPTTVGNQCISDTRDVGLGFERAIWTPDGKALFFLVSEEGSCSIYKVAAAGGKPERITPLGRELGGTSADARAGRIAFSVSDHTHPGEIAVLDVAEGGEPRTLSAHNKEFLESHWVGTPEEIRVTSAPGVEIQGWILKPPGFQEGTKYPAILEIHGGPHVQYASSFFHEMQYLAGRGYVVLWTNPRGSLGYGEAHTKAIVKDWGGADSIDVLAAVDHLVAQGYVDETRLGVTGGSYGGFMTNWLVGHTDRFRAAATQRSVVNLYSFYGESDFGYAFEHELYGRPWDDEETALQYLRMSPLHYVKNVKTPLLIIHSDQDHRCPISQGEELYTALKMLKREVAMIRFEGESHGLSRGGRPQNRLERLKRIGDWFDRYLEPGAGAGTR